MMQFHELVKKIQARGGLLGKKNGEQELSILVDYAENFDIIGGVLFVQRGRKTVSINLSEYSDLTPASKGELETFRLVSTEIKKTASLIALSDLFIVGCWAAYAGAYGWTPKAIAWAALGVVLSTCLGLWKILCIRSREGIAGAKVRPD